MPQSKTIIRNGNVSSAIQEATQILRGGGIVGMPTETVYGLAANALDVSAVAKVFEAKARPSFDPLIVHVESVDQADTLAVFDPMARRLAEAFWPGPMTLVLPRKHDEQGQPVVPDLVTAGLDSVGIRMPDHPVASALLKASRHALAAPSANRFGSISPTLAQHVVDELGDKVDAVLDGGPCDRGLESTVLRVEESGVQVLRLGALPVELIEQVVGQHVAVQAPSSSPGQSVEEAKPAPGMVERHYAPGTPMRLFKDDQELNRFKPVGRWALLCVGSVPDTIERFDVLRNLSESGDLAFAAACLFSTLRELDGMGLDGIAGLAVPDETLGKAINDRLRRGSVR